MCSTTWELFEKADVRPEEIGGMAAYTQYMGAMFVDEHGNALRRPMNYLDQRGVSEFKACMDSGIIKVSGCNLYKVLRKPRVNYTAPASAKDPIWKYKWVENNEPQVFGKAHKWLDIGDYLLAA